MAEQNTSYDFSNAKQGVHHRAYREGVSVREAAEPSSASRAAKNSVPSKRQTRGERPKQKPERASGKPNLVLIEPEIFRVFERPEAINQALRVLIQAGKSSVRATRKKAG